MPAVCACAYVPVCVYLPPVCMCTVQAEMQLHTQALDSVSSFAHLPVGELGKCFNLLCLSFSIHRMQIWSLIHGTAVIM